MGCSRPLTVLGPREVHDSKEIHMILTNVSNLLDTKTFYQSHFIGRLAPDN